MTTCFFTASGNCLYVARRIGGTLLSIPQLMRQEAIEIADDTVGIVCPVYAVEMPMMVHEFLLKAKIKIAKLRPIIYDEEEGIYLGIGDKVADAFRAGIEVKKSLNRGESNE